MKLLSISALFLLTLSITSCKSGDKCGDCPTFSNVEKIEKKEQI